MKILILFVAVLTISFTAFGQKGEGVCPKITNNKNGISKVTGLNNDYKKDFTCRLVTIKGRITGLLYNEDSSDVVSGVVIQSADGSRETIYFIDEYLLNCFSEADKGNWKVQLVKGAKVIIKAYACGAGGKSDLAIASIEFLTKSSIKSRKRTQSNIPKNNFIRNLI